MAIAVKVLVTGTHGQLAQSLKERSALTNDVEVVCLGRPDLDLEKPETVAKAVQRVAPDVVVNAAAYTAVDQAEDEPDVAYAINVTAVGCLAAASKAIGAPFIQISTDYVYDGCKVGAYTETDAVNPQSVYGRTKLEGERRAASESPDHIILRTAWVYSPFGKNFVRTMLGLAATRDRLNVVGDQTGNPTSALDLADAVLKIIHRRRRDPAAGRGQVYHCAGTGDTNWCDFARHIFETSRSSNGPFAEAMPIKASEWPSKAQRPLNSCLDCRKFEFDFGWRAPDWHTSSSLVVSRVLAERPLVTTR